MILSIDYSEKEYMNLYMLQTVALLALNLKGGLFLFIAPPQN